MKGCNDLRIAAAAAARKGAVHHTCEMSAENWLRLRPEAVWWTDGELNLMHMHVVTILPRVAELFDIGLDGCAANGVIGDAWIEQGMAGVREYFRDRPRRFLVLGPTTVRSFIETRFPFLDNRFVELAVAAPDHLKKDNSLYRIMLLIAFPSFYETIPWQHTGSPIRWPRPTGARGHRVGRLRGKLLQALRHHGLYKSAERGYADYATWIRQEPARTFVREVLSSASALYPAYVSRARVDSDLAKHLEGKDRSESLCRMLTFEIWLRQVFEGKYRTMS